MNDSPEATGVAGMLQLKNKLELMDLSHTYNMKRYLPNGPRPARIKDTTRQGLVVNCKDTSQHGLAGCFQTTRKGIVSNEWFPLSDIEFLDEVQS